MLQTYGTFRPTAYDGPGLHADDLGIRDWFVAPVSQTRDANSIELSNFRSCLAELGGESETVQVHRFGHWGQGWFEIIVVDPGDPDRVRTLQMIADRLENYPVLDEDDYSTLEGARATEYWTRASLRARVEWCQRYDVSIFAARRDEIPEDPCGGLISALAAAA